MAMVVMMVSQDAPQFTQLHELQPVAMCSRATPRALHIQPHAEMRIHAHKHFQTHDHEYDQV
jgi:hypothetical protein